jgi:hypothetical protein
MGTDDADRLLAYIALLEKEVVDASEDRSDGGGPRILAEARDTAGLFEADCEAMGMADPLSYATEHRTPESRALLLHYQHLRD